MANKIEFISFSKSRRDRYDNISLGDAEETKSIFDNSRQLSNCCKIISVENKSMN